MPLFSIHKPGAKTIKAWSENSEWERISETVFRKIEIEEEPSCERSENHTRAEVEIEVDQQG